MTTTISDKDNGYGQLMVNARSLGTKTFVRVGVSDAPHEGTPGLTIADIGAMHEFGLGHNPQRSFLRAWVDQHQNTWFEWLRTLTLKRLYFRVQPTGKSLSGHQSGLAYEKVAGVFAFDDPTQLFNTYTASQVAKSPDAYEMISFTATEVDRPEDSEGVVVAPGEEVSRTSFKNWLSEFGLRCVAGVRARILEGIGPALNPKTVQRKQAEGQPSTPLRATDQLLKGIVFDIKRST